MLEYWHHQDKHTYPGNRDSEETIQIFIFGLMNNPIFRFKEFEVDQTGCTMKINTDGVLLGALADHESPAHILDIGTGTGVIALMLAQRFPTARVDAVEIDRQAARGAQRNFQNSKFSERLHAIESSFEAIKGAYSYDLIVSNPPFYTNSLHNPDERLKKAKHTDISFFTSMLAFAQNRLRHKGQLQLILPTNLATAVIRLAQDHNLQPVKVISVRSFRNTEIIRQIVYLQKDVEEAITESDFVIYVDRGVYSKEYQEVLQPFFLAY